MLKEIHLVWNQTLEVLEQQLPQQNFEKWLKKTKPLTFYDNLLVIAVQNEIAKDRIEARYGALLRKILWEVTRRNLELRFVVPKDSILQNGDTHAGQSVSADPVRAGSAVVPSTLPHGPGGEPNFKPLNSKYTFDTFVVGNSNRFAHAAAQAVAESPAKAYNPFFIYGGVGLGKTHLMHAIGHYVLGSNPNARVAYVSTETFTNEFINSIRDDKSLDFQNRYRNVDVLLVDDIQFLAGKERTQEEFYHTFNAIHEANKQVVISSDRPPKEIPTLEDRLRSRFEWGLICDIQAPDLETRIAILRKKAQIDCLDVPDEVIGYIADSIETNIRELEGALNRVVAYSGLMRSPVTIHLATHALKDILPPSRPKQVTIETIMQVVAEYYGVKVDDLKVRKRTRTVVFPRQVAMYLCRDLTDCSLPKIGEEFGGRDHTTVIHACEKIARDAPLDPSLAGDIEHLIQKLKSD